MSTTDRLRRGLQAYTLSRVVFTLSNAVLILVLTRYLLTSSEYGLLYFALSVLSVGTIFGTLGLPKAAAKYVTEYAERDPTQVRYILRTSGGAILAAALVVAVVVVFGRSLLASLLDEPAVVPFLLVGGAYVVARTLNAYFAQIFRGFNRVTWTAAVQSAMSIARVGFAIGLVVLGFGALGAFSGYVLGYAVGALLGAVLCWRLYATFEEAETTEPGLLRKVLRYSVPLTATKGAGAIDNRIDTILVGILINTTAVGYYTLAKQISDFAVMPATSMGFTMSPTLGEQKANDELRRAATLYEQSLKHTLLLYIPACFGLAVVAEPLIRYVFSGEYLGATPVLQVFSLYVFIHAVNKITSDGLDFLGRADDRAVAKILMALANLGLNLLFIPRFGVVGAAVATVITYSLYTGTNVYFIYQELGFRIRPLVRATVVVVGISLVVAGVVAFLRPYISGVVFLFAAIALGIGIWAVLTLASGVMDVEWVSNHLI